MSTVIKDKFHTAKKWHYCGNCGRVIYPGMKYRRLYGRAYDFDPLIELKLCENCTDPMEDGHTVMILNG